MPKVIDEIQLRIASNGTLLQLSKYQIKGFTGGDICPFCKEPNLIYRSWRADYICGMCFEVFRLDGGVYHLGRQDQID